MKHNILVAALLSVSVLSGCDNYLDLVPKGESVFNTTEDYLGLLEDVNGFPLDDEWYLSGETAANNMDDIINYKNPTISAAYFWNEDFDRAKFMTKTGSNDMYSECYRRIAKYNVMIDNLNDSKGKAEDKIAGIAQAKILRAYNYLYLINTYAKPYNSATAATDRGIILRSKFSLEEKGVQSTVADAYKLIQSDIDEAIPNLPSKSLNTFRPNKAFGYSLKAKVHLVKLEINQALDASLAAIVEGENGGGNRLWDMNVDYTTVVKTLSSMYGGLPVENFEFGGSLYNSLVTMGSRLYSHDYSDSENLFYAHGTSFMAPQPMYIRKPIIDLYDRTADLRFILCLLKVNNKPLSDAGSLQYMAGNVKWNVGGMRLSETYLMAAECYARKGDVQNSMRFLNTLRKKRIMAKKYNDVYAADAHEAMTLVRQERQRELVLTSNGFFDMRRFCTEFKETPVKVFKGETYRLKHDSHLLTFPFPVSAMQNSNLVQNSK